MKKQIAYTIVLVSVMAFLVWSCSDNSKRIKNVELVATGTEAEDCLCPHCRILVQPYGDFSRDKALEVSRQLEQALNQHMTGIAVTDVLVMPNKPLTAHEMNNAGTRYRAIKILDQQQRMMQQQGDVIIGLTDKDISTTLHGQDDFGILGLTYVNKSNSVISTFRVKDKSQLWKVVLHEFGHGFLGLPHCPNNDPSCFMVDANGKPNLTPQHHFCDSCSKHVPT